VDDDGTYDYRRRLQLMGDLHDRFLELNRLKLRQKAHIASEAADAAIEEIFSVRSEIVVALR
jgi:hypothetical protein